MSEFEAPLKMWTLGALRVRAAQYERSGDKPAALAELRDEIARREIDGKTSDAPLASRRDLRTVELPEDAKIGEVFVVMLDEGGDAQVQRASDTGAVMTAATMPAARLLAELSTGADRQLAILVEGGASFEAGEVEVDERGSIVDRHGQAVMIDDVKKMLHAWCRNLAQGLAGRVLP